MGDTTDVIQARYDASKNAVIGFLPQQPYARRITSIALQGPRSSTFRMYRGDRIEPSLQITSTPTGNGADSSYDSTTEGAPLKIGPSEQVIGVWTGGAVAAGQVGTAVVRSVY